MSQRKASGNRTQLRRPEQLLKSLPGESQNLRPGPNSKKQSTKGKQLSLDRSQRQGVSPASVFILANSAPQIYADQHGSKLGTSKQMKVKRQADHVVSMFIRAIRGPSVLANGAPQIYTDQHGSRAGNEQADEGQETSNRVVSVFIRAIRGPSVLRPTVHHKIYTDQHGSRVGNEQADEGQETSNHVVSVFIRAIRGSISHSLDESFPLSSRIERGCTRGPE